jgi:quercetin dioxygenase-like cupin family protein
MKHFINLREILRSLHVDPSTAQDPVKRMFIGDGEFLTANIATEGEAGGAIHTQPAHDEIVIVLEGEAEFRVGDETRHIAPGDMVFIPRNTPHGRERLRTPRFSALSIYAPFFDRSKKTLCGKNVARQHRSVSANSRWNGRAIRGERDRG